MKQAGTQLLSASQDLPCPPCSHDPSKAQLVSHGAQGECPVPSVAFPAYYQSLPLKTPQVMRLPHQKLNTARSQANWPYVSLQRPQDALLFAKTLWPEASVSLIGRNCEKTQPVLGGGPCPWATFFSETTQ